MITEQNHDHNQEIIEVTAVDHDLIDSQLSAAKMNLFFEIKSLEMESFKVGVVDDNFSKIQNQLHGLVGTLKTEILSSLNSQNIKYEKLFDSLSQEHAKYKDYDTCLLHHRAKNFPMEERDIAALDAKIASNNFEKRKAILELNEASVRLEQERRLWGDVPEEKNILERFPVLSNLFLAGEFVVVALILQQSFDVELLLAACISIFVCGLIGITSQGVVKSYVSQLKTQKANE